MPCNLKGKKGNVSEDTNSFCSFDLISLFLLLSFKKQALNKVDLVELQYKLQERTFLSGLENGYFYISMIMIMVMIRSIYNHTCNVSVKMLILNSQC